MVRLAFRLHRNGVSRNPGVEQSGTHHRQGNEERTRKMKRLFATLLSVAVVVALSASSGMGQTSCPPEVASAKAMLTQTASGQDLQPSRSLGGARSQELQAPRSQELQAPRSQELQAPRGQELQAPRSQELQAPRSQELQAPRSQELQAPRSQELQAPRSQELQAPRGQELQAPRSRELQAPRGQELQAPRSEELSRAATLVGEAEAACKAGNPSLAAEKAKAAMGLLKK